MMIKFFRNGYETYFFINLKLRFDFIECLNHFYDQKIITFRHSNKLLYKKIYVDYT